MEKMKNKLSILAAIVFGIICLLVPSTQVKASVTKIPYDENGIFLGTYVWDYDLPSSGNVIDFEQVDYKLVYVNKLRMPAIQTVETDNGKSYKSYPEGSLELYIANDVPDYEIVSVKSNKKGLKCMLEREDIYTYNDGSSERHEKGMITLRATKAGTYTVTVTLKFADGRIAQTSATVLVPKKQSLTYSFSGAEELSTNAKEGYLFKGKSVRIKVKTGTKIGAAKIYYFNTCPKAGEEYESTIRKFRTVKNGGKIRMKTLENYTISWSNTTQTKKSLSNRTETEYPYFIKTETEERSETYSTYYPVTIVKIAYKDKFYGITDVHTIYIRKYKKY